MANLAADVTVALDGTGDYMTVAAAIDAAPCHSEKKHVIHIKQGTYKEFLVVPQDKPNIVLIGDGMEATIITGNRSNADKCGDQLCKTSETAVVHVYGAGFIARDLCIENTAGPKPENGQAVALLLISDQSVLYRCALVGYQDTLYCKGLQLKQFYRDCRISGTVDFIFGEAKAVFQNCQLFARVPYHGQDNTITAQGRKSAADDGAFCFQRCTVAADKDLAKGTVQTYLGRPWKDFSRVIFMQCTMSDVVSPKGWRPWKTGGGDAAPDTIYYAEYENDGPGAAVSGRVYWRGVHTSIDVSEASSFTVAKFIDGNSWLPSTGVQYDGGLN